MAEYLIQDTTLTAIADAIRSKTETTDAILAADMAELIESIETGGSDKSNIIFGSFTLTEILSSSSPLYIDIQLPSQSFPLMYLVFEDSREYTYTDVSHTSNRIKALISVQAKSGIYNLYVSAALYNASGSSTIKLVSGTVNHSDDGYSNSGGYYGLASISLDESKLRIKNTEDGVPFLQGRTYYYILYWG